MPAVYQGLYNPINRQSILNFSIAPLDLGIAPYVLYGVKYIGPVSLEAARPVNLSILHSAPFVQNGVQGKSGCEMRSDIGTQYLGCWGKTRLHTPKAVTYHAQPHIINHT